MSYLLPLSSIITSFHSMLKSISSGFASFDYEEAPYEPSDLVRMNVLVNGTKIDALCTVLHRSELEKEARAWVKRLKEAIPRQNYEVCCGSWVLQHSTDTKTLSGYYTSRGRATHYCEGAVRH
jgi:GTP-binding protein LepA